MQQEHQAGQQPVFELHQERAQGIHDEKKADAEEDDFHTAPRGMPVQRVMSSGAPGESEEIGIVSLRGIRGEHRDPQQNRS